MVRSGAIWGLSSVFRGLGFLLRTPATWVRAAAPTLVFLLLLAGAAALSFTWLRPALAEWIGVPVETAVGESARIDWGGLGKEAVVWFATLLAFGLGALIALVLTPPLASPALEGLVTLREASLQVLPRQGGTFWGELLCGLRAQLFGVLVLGPLALTTWLLGLVIPAAAPVLTPLSFFCTCFGVAWNLLDYPLTLRGVGARQRFSFLRRHIGTCLGFGAGFAVLFWVPCFGVLFLGAGVCAATEVVWHLVSLDAEAPAELRAAIGRADGAEGPFGEGQPSS